MTLIIEFLSEWLVTFLMPGKACVGRQSTLPLFHVLQRNIGLESYIWVLKLRHRLTDRRSYTRIIDGQVRCITPEFKPKDLQVAWNVQFITVFVPAWMIPPIYHSLRRESIKNTNSASAIGVKSIRPTYLV